MLPVGFPDGSVVKNPPVPVRRLRRCSFDPWLGKIPLEEEMATYSRQHIKKHRNYLAKKVHVVKSIVLPVVMYACDSCTIKKDECRRADAFDL